MLNNQEEAFKHLKKSVEIRETIFGPRNFRVANGYRRIGKMFSDLQNFDKAIENFKIALKV